MTYIQSIPLAQLRLSPRNVRKTGATAVDELAASIAAEGVLNNLVVTAANDGQFEVEDGGRRLQALQLLQNEGRLTDALSKVPCHVVEAERGTEAGLTANLMRQAMHPADEFVAFQQLVAEGKAIGEIAVRFGKTARHIEQRLRLANVRPDLFEIYRAGGMNIDQLTALATTDNHELQRQAWETARSEYERSPTHLRDFITRESVRSDSPLPRFVGLEAYELAGGRVRTDLFSEHVYLLDLPLLDSLALDRLEAIAEQLRADGWAWVEARVSMSPQERHAYDNHPRYFSAKGDDQFASPEDETRHAEISARLDAIDDIDVDELDADAARALQDEEDRLYQERDIIDGRCVASYPADVRAESGVLVYLSDGGNLEYQWARLLPSRKSGAAVPVAPASSNSATKPAKKPELSEAMRATLSAHRSAAAAMQLAKDPTLAHCVLLERLLMSHWPNCYGNNGLHLAFGNSGPRTEADIHKAISAAITERLQIIKQVPRKDTLQFLLRQTDAWRLELQAALVVAHFDGATGSDRGHEGVDAIHLITDFNMAQHWSPEVDNFAGRIHADLLAQGVTEAKGKDQAATLSGLKKDERAALGAKLLAGTGWLPKLLRGPSYGKKLEQTNTTTEPASKHHTGAKKAAVKKAPAKKIAAKKPAKKAPKKAAAPKAKPAKKKS
ncbi:ParB/RepB/Spo0J family partition protein [Pseudoxanthomonas sp. LH2527]|uniref:ParB/RepB/Spo0J family partition protein n=1 Tax=Pseudoxanthomonas sp. LH2527 TaxID=2923249 RepID=UPI001F1452DC|nr:ParB/RepB/Spo0J family partition protein [Pseudoxanthomonas sp. LH2527]MCH6484282.1 ParB/RepB/Spo0J family partition protein [Pseudoxanthomonas sp. LH2527]